VVHGRPARLDRPRVVDARLLRQFSALGNNIVVFPADAPAGVCRRAPSTS
jgi:hypothetical protein